MQALLHNLDFTLGIKRQSNTVLKLLIIGIGCPILLLDGQCAAKFSSDFNLTHLNQNNQGFQDCYNIPGMYDGTSWS